ncbi:putative inactive dehydrogenase EasA [Mycena sanguinolenta]|uniref:Putative inactive dehydrogenase EasA n=1 Tax=Mycena sanguinolenta TaxID=230812 RepID=A0A8H7CAK6_9AGAR|nr:putative inactive dehydrogenase EasA [Mycena sanguinolenta]
MPPSSVLRPSPVLHLGPAPVPTPLSFARENQHGETPGYDIDQERERFTNGLVLPNGNGRSEHVRPLRSPLALPQTHLLYDKQGNFVLPPPPPPPLSPTVPISPPTTVTTTMSPARLPDPYLARGGRTTAAQSTSPAAYKGQHLPPAPWHGCEDSPASQSDYWVMVNNNSLDGVGDILLSHHIVLAPATRFRAVPTLWRRIYAQRANTPGSLLSSEATLIASGYKHAPGIWSDEPHSITPLTSRQTGFPTCLRLASLRVSLPSTKSKNMLSYTNAVRCAGFDGFLHDGSNIRIDKYDGSRRGFPLVVVDAVVKAACTSSTATHGQRTPPSPPSDSPTSRAYLHVVKPHVTAPIKDGYSIHSVWGARRRGVHARERRQLGCVSWVYHYPGSAISAAVLGNRALYYASNTELPLFKPIMIDSLYFIPSCL